MYCLHNLNYKTPTGFAFGPKNAITYETGGHDIIQIIFDIYICIITIKSLRPQIALHISFLSIKRIIKTESIFFT